MILNRMKKSVLAAIISIFTLYLFTASSPPILASSSGTDGFIIEAEEITGTLGVPLIVIGETATRKAVPMIDLAMDNLEIKDLVIKKVTQTPNGPVTTVIKSGGVTKLKKMRVRITNIELGGIFIPKLGYLGMKDVKLLAYKQTADYADLPSFSLNYETGNANQMKDEGEEGLKEIIKSLQNGGKKEEDEQEEADEEKDSTTDEEKQPDEQINTDKEKPEEPAKPDADPKTEPADEEETADDPETEAPAEPGKEEDEVKPEDPPNEEPPPDQGEKDNGDQAPGDPNAQITK